MDESRQPEQSHDKRLSDRENFNLVTDTVAGPNLRLKDNVIQALAIAVCMAIGAVVGGILAEMPIVGVLVGAFGGMVIGVFASGIFLMIFRAVRHLRGRHD